MTGNITTSGEGSHGIYSLDSDSNTYTVTEISQLLVIMLVASL